MMVDLSSLVEFSIPAAWLVLLFQGLLGIFQGVEAGQGEIFSQKSGNRCKN